MTTASTTSAGQYVYAFVRSSDADFLVDQDLLGLNEASLNATCHGEIAAITSNIVAEKIRPQRKLLAAHQSVVTRIAQAHDMLPVSFGLIADNEEQLKHILEANEEIIREQLDRVGGQVEMNLTLSWKTENVFQYFVERNDDLLEARDYVASGEATRDQMIEVGRLFEQLLNQQRESHGQNVSDALSEICKEVDLQPTRSEQEIVRLNCLLDRNKEPEFTEAIHKIASGYDDEYVFNFSGPWPPYSFVNLSLSME